VVIEIWDKFYPEQDELLGLIKLPLHPFYLAFQEDSPEIFSTSSARKFYDYPFISVHQYCPIFDPIKSSHAGSLHVLLAMGTEKQIRTFQNHSRAAVTLQKFIRGFVCRKYMQDMALSLTNLNRKKMRQEFLQITKNSTKKNASTSPLEDLPNQLPPQPPSPRLLFDHAQKTLPKEKKPNEESKIRITIERAANLPILYQLPRYLFRKTESSQEFVCVGSNNFNATVWGKFFPMPT
jgi:hypothetical protein